MIQPDLKHYEIVKTKDGDLKMLSFNVKETDFYFRLHIEDCPDKRLIEGNHVYLRYNNDIRKIDHKPTPQAAIDHFKTKNHNRQISLKKQLEIEVEDFMTVLKIQHSIQLVGIEKHLEIWKEIENDNN